MIIRLPYSHALRSMQGVHLIRDGGLYNDTYELEEPKLVISRWTVTDEYPHDCVSNGDCANCPNNLRTHHKYMEISTKVGKTVIKYHCQSGDKDGDVFSDWEQVGLRSLMTPAK